FYFLYFSEMIFQAMGKALFKKQYSVVRSKFKSEGIVSTQCRRALPVGGLTMLWPIFFILLIMWGLGFAFKIAGGLVRILLVIALIILIVRLVTGRSP